MTPEQAYWDAHAKNGGPPNIEDIEPIVGFEYSCLTAMDSGGALLPNPHEDADHFNCTERHYHYDSRFEIVGPVAYAVTGPVVRAIHTCKRTTPTLLPFMNSGWISMGLYADYGACRPMCGMCPHKGLPIHNGVCSGHRIKFKYTTPFYITRGNSRWEVSDIWTDNNFAFNGPIPIGNELFRMRDSNGIFMAQAPMPVECPVTEHDTFNVRGRCK